MAVGLGVLSLGVIVTAGTGVDVGVAVTTSVGMMPAGVELALWCFLRRDLMVRLRDLSHTL